VRSYGGIDPRRAARWAVVGAACLALLSLLLVALVQGGSSPTASANRAATEGGAARIKSGAARIVSGRHLKLRGIYVGDRRLRVMSGRVAQVASTAGVTLGSRPTPAPLMTPLQGFETPVAVAEPHGRAIAYNTWRFARPIDWTRAPSSQDLDAGDVVATPEVFVRDAATGRDVSLGAGTVSVTYRHDGAIAYTRGNEHYRFETPYARDILVSEAPGAAPVTWSDGRADYSVVGWAGERLLVHRGVPGTESVDAVVADGPGRLRTLAESGEIVAISPSGASIVASVRSPRLDTEVLKLIEIASGSTIDEISVQDLRNPPAGERLVFADDPGDWQDDELVVRTDSGLMVLRATDTQVSVVQLIHMELNGSPLNEPRFLDHTRTVVEAWANVPESRASVRYQCNRITLVCSTGGQVPVEGFARPAYDRSAGETGP
jgi:hypothetical protein